ncbi:MAG: protein translocase subunit SecD [Nitriliruptoraceae bacterium]
MNRRPLIVILAVVLVLVAAASTVLVLGARPNLGLDLQGGISAVYEPRLPEGQPRPDDFEAVLDETIEIIRARVDSLGVSEPDISRSGTDVLVQLPGVDDPDRLRELIGRTAQLTFRPVIDVIVPGMEGYADGPDCAQPSAVDDQLPHDEAGIVCGPEDSAVLDPATDELKPMKYQVGPAALTGDRIEDAFPALGDGQGFSVTLELDTLGARQFAEISSQLACERDAGGPGLLAIVLDGVVESAPTMASGVACGIGIRDGIASITVGSGSIDDQEQEARDLALVLQTGALPITLEEATFQQVSPTLGAESLRSGVLAGLIGLVLVGIWLIWFYRTLGVVALAALTVFGVWVAALVSMLGAVGFALTLAGVAGLIVSIGITADSSIIFFERIRDEVNLGKTMRTAVRRAFASAFRTNLAGNTVTLAAAVILYFLAVGPVRGFALMLGMATVLDLLIMWGFTRPVVWLLSTSRLLTRWTVRAAASPAPGGAA